MNMSLVEALLGSPTEEAVTQLLEADDTVFWVDWREEEDAIVESCEGVLQTGRLTAEVVDVDTADRFEVYVTFATHRHKMPLTYSPADRHIALCTLNDALRPDYEVRVCVDSGGGDSLAFLPLASDQWATLEGRYGEA